MYNAGTVQAFVGTFRRLGGAGIYAVRFDTQTLRFGPVTLAADIVDPIYLAMSENRRILYSVGAIDVGTREGLVAAFRVEEDSEQLIEIDRRATGGVAACHVAVNDKSGILIVSNYLSGSIGAFRVSPAGTLVNGVQSIQHFGASIHPQRQTSPHPHSATFDPAGRRVIVCDLGADRLVQYPVSNEGRALEEPSHNRACESGSGPRHLAFHPSGRFAYVVNEISSTVTALAYTEGAGVSETIGTSTALPLDWNGDNTAAAIRLNPLGNRLYVSNRGHDSIATFEVDVVTGELEPIGCVSVRGRVPRDFVFAPDGRSIVVANQGSGTIVAMAIDMSTGLPDRVADEVQIPGAVSVVLHRVGMPLV